MGVQTGAPYLIKSVPSDPMNIHRWYALFGARFRARRMQDFAQTLQPADGDTILDVGGHPHTWHGLPRQVRVTALNIYPIEFTPTAEYPPIELVVGDGCRLDYADRAFDLVFSNSVIEHLGTFERQQAFAAEARRVGRKLWVQTPAREFFIEPHLLAPFIHYLPVALQRRLIRRFTLWGMMTKPSPAGVEAFLQEVRLLSFAEMQQLFPDCEIRREKAFGFTKSYVAVRRAA